MHDPDVYLHELTREIPGLRLVYKREDSFSRVLSAAVRVATFGAQSRYMTRYVTTIGRTIYVPEGWDARDPRNRYVTLRHEAVHLRQFRRMGRVGMSLVYLLPLFPLGLAWGRARLEWEAYAETFRATAEVFGPHVAEREELREHVLKQFVSGAYGWMWPFPKVVNGWIDEVLQEIRASQSSGSTNGAAGRAKK